VPLNGFASHRPPTVQLPLPTEPPPTEPPPTEATRPIEATRPVEATPPVNVTPPVDTAPAAPPAPWPIPLEPQTAATAQPVPQADSIPSSGPAAPPRRRRSTKRRLPTQKIFSDLAAQAAIPAAAYAIGEDVDGAMCLVRTDEGFEVFNSMAGSRHEVRLFQDEESAYFYLFGVLVADAVRTGALAPRD
jgi:hypothetical protein